MSIEAKITKLREKKLDIEASKVEKSSGEQLVLKLRGLLDTENSGDFSSSMSDLIETELQGHYEELVIDAAGLTYASSTGIGSLVHILVTCNKNDVELLLRNVPQHIVGVMDLLGFSSYFTFLDSTD